MSEQYEDKNITIKITGSTSTTKTIDSDILRDPIVYDDAIRYYNTVTMYPYSYSTVGTSISAPEEDGKADKTNHTHLPFKISKMNPPTCIDCQEPITDDLNAQVMFAGTGMTLLHINCPEAKE